MRETGKGSRGGGRQQGVRHTPQLGSRRLIETHLQEPELGHSVRETSRHRGDSRKLLFKFDI